MASRCTVLLVLNVLLVVVICEAELASSSFNTNTPIDVDQAEGEGWRSRALMDQDSDPSLLEPGTRTAESWDPDSGESDSNFGDFDVCPDGAEYKKQRCRGGKVVESYYETYALFRLNDEYETSEPIDNNPSCLPASAVVTAGNLRLPEEITSVILNTCLKDTPDGLAYALVMYNNSHCQGKPMYTLPATHSRCDGGVIPSITFFDLSDPCVRQCPMVIERGLAFFMGQVNDIAVGDLTVLSQFCESASSAVFAECSQDCSDEFTISNILVSMATCLVDQDIMDAVGSRWQQSAPPPVVEVAVRPTAVPGDSGGMPAMASASLMLAIALVHLLH